MNKVILIGHLGADAELKYTQGGQAVSSIRICTTEKWTGKDGQKQERSEWHRCNYWGKAAEAVNKYLTKGKQVSIEGSIQTRSWEKDGEKRFSTEIKVDRLELLGGGPRNDGGGGGQQRRDPSRGRAAVDPNTGAVDDGFGDPDDDIPF